MTACAIPVIDLIRSHQVLGIVENAALRHGSIKFSKSRILSDPVSIPALEQGFAQTLPPLSATR
jgi:hypothetical protein